MRDLAHYAQHSDRYMSHDTNERDGLEMPPVETEERHQGEQLLSQREQSWGRVSGQSVGRWREPVAGSFTAATASSKAKRQMNPP